MPFYFALPRTGQTSTQGRQGTGRVDYVRTAPTTLTFTTSVLRTRMTLTYVNNLHGIAMSVFAGRKSGLFNKGFFVDNPGRLLYTQVPNTDTISITLPKMSFRFANLTEAQEDRLDELGMEERNVKGKGRIWVGSLLSTHAAEVAKYDVLSDYSAMGGTVSIRGVQAIRSILQLVTLSAQTLSLANNSGRVSCHGVEYSSRSAIAFHKYKTSDMSETTSEDDLAGKTNVTSTNTGKTMILASDDFPCVSTTTDQLSGFVSNGIFCPFEPNYSQTDRRAVHLLLSDFSCLATEDETFEYFDEEMVEMWTKEISLTMEGEFIAHMIASLSLAKRVGAQICFLVTGNLYEGAVLYGAQEFSFKLVGGMVYGSMDNEALVKDIEKYAFHSTTLTEILQEAGIGEDVHPRQIKTMRQLRTLIMGKLGHALTPLIQATLGKKLLFLNFREKQETLNPSTMSKLLSYIHPTSPMAIPESVYLDRRAFFSTDTVELALSMFGMYAPSPIISGQTLVLAVPPGSPKKASNEPPSIQFCFKELSVSAKDWEGFFRGGAIVQPTQKTRRSRRFAGSEKSEIWGQLTTLAAAGISAKRNETSAKKNDKAAEKRDRDDNEAFVARDDKKSKMAGVDFSMFDSGMAS